MRIIPICVLTAVLTANLQAQEYDWVSPTNGTANWSAATWAGSGGGTPTGSATNGNAAFIMVFTNGTYTANNNLNPSGFTMYQLLTAVNGPDNVTLTGFPFYFPQGSSDSRIENQAAGGTLTVNVPFELDTGYHMYIKPVGTIVFNGVISGSANDGVQVTDVSGFVYFGATNTFTSALNINNEGSIVAMCNSPNGASGAFGNSSGAIDCPVGGNGGNTSCGVYGGVGGVTIGRNIQVNSVASGSHTYVGGLNTNGVVTFANYVEEVNGQALELWAAPGGTVNFSQGIANNYSSSSVIIEGGGSVEMTNLDTYGGTNIVQNGYFLLSGNDTGGASPLNQNGLTVQLGNSGTPVTPATATIGLLTVGAFTIDHNISVNAYGSQIVIGANTTGNSTFAGTITLHTNVFLQSVASEVTTFSGPISGTGFGVTITNAGTVQLTGTNTYSGATTVSTGTLLLGTNGSIGASTTTVSSGATLGGASTNTTTIGAATTYSSGASAYFTAIGGASTRVGQISVTGNLTLNANAVTVNVTGSALKAGTYRLLSCSGSLANTGSFGTPNITGTALSSGYTASISVTTGSSGHLDLVVNATPAFSGLTASPSITYGATSVTLSGTVSSTGGPTTVYPANGDIVSATINSITVDGAVNNNTGGFSITYNDPSLQTDGVGSSPYTITYAYGGDSVSNLNAAANNTSTSLTVNQATPTLTAPTATPIAYGNTLAGSSLSGGAATNALDNAAVGGSFAFTTPSTAPNVGVDSESVTFSPTDTTDYTTASTSVNVTVGQQTPTLTAPTATAITYGQTLAGSTLSGGAATNAANSAAVTGSFAFTTPSTVPGAGTPSESVTFTPTGPGSTNYTTAATSVNVTVNQAGSSLTLTSSTNPCGFNTSVSFTASGLPTNASGSVVFLTNSVTFDTEGLSSGSATSVATTALPPGTNVITAGYAGDSNYTGSTNTLNQVETEPVATPMTVQRTAGTTLLIALSDIATNWSDVVSGVGVEMTNINLVTTNNVTLMLLNVTTNADGSFATNSDSFVGYTNGPNVNDQFSYSLVDQYGATSTGIVNIVILPSVTGTNSIVSIVSGNPTTLTAYGIPGDVYVTQRATNLMSPVWVNIATNTAATNGVISVTDNFSDLGNQQPSSAYYRLSWSPLP